MLKINKNIFMLSKKRTLPKQSKDLDPEVILEIEHLTMRFGGLVAINDLSVQVRRGEIFGLIGPNGAGKTTVFNCITQFYKPTSGQVYFRGRNNRSVLLNSIAPHDIIRHGIIRTFQNVELVWELSVLENLLVTNITKSKNLLLRSLLNLPKLRKEEETLKAKAIEILSFLGLSQYQNVSPYGLPYGIKKKIELARTLMCDPELIILDEPAAGLNEKETEELGEMIKVIRDKYQTTIFLVEHDMPLVMGISDRIGAINFGKLIGLGNASQIQSNPAVQSAYLGSE